MKLLWNKIIVVLAMSCVSVHAIASPETASSPACLLAGKHAGVKVSSVDGSVDGLMNVYVRGLNTLRGDSQPLWIVDGAVIGSCVNQNLNSFYLSGGKTINGNKLPDYSGRSYAAPVNSFRWLNPYDIESIEILKDISATALYGMAGANGVIIVKTRRPASEKSNIWLNSNVGAGLPVRSGEPFKTGILTTHDIGMNGVFGTNSFYNISGFARYDSGYVQNANSLSGGVTLNLETVANERFQFGLMSRLSGNKDVHVSGTNFIGEPSLMVLSRNKGMFPSEKLSSWLTSYDDEVFDYRTVNSIWLGVKLHETLRLKIDAGIDFQSQNRLIWYGTGTSFGKEFKGAVSILNNSLLNTNLSARLSFDRTFAIRHHLQADVAFDFNGYSNRTNAMCGTDFDLPHLRGKGLSSSSSLHAIRKFARRYGRIGGYALISYDYDGYAGLKGIVRCDCTSRFDKTPSWFPSGEAYVDLKKIFLMESSTVSSLKLSGGYGHAGLEMVLPYEYISAYVPDVPEVEAGAEPYFDGINRLLSKEYNIGIEAGFLGGRYNVSLKYYDKSTDDVFRIYDFSKQLSGLWVATENWKIHQQRSSTIRNRGIELQADMNFIRKKHISWNACLNAAYNVNSAVSLDEHDIRNNAAIQKGSYMAEFKERTSLAQILGRNTIPRVHGGFGTVLSLYGATLEADFSGAAGFSIFNAHKYIERGLGVITQGDVERGDYLRLDRLACSYVIPVKIKWMKEFKVTISAYNLFTITGYDGWNPDVNSFGGVTSRSFGVDYGSFPACRQIVLGLSFRF